MNRFGRIESLALDFVHNVDEDEDDDEYYCLNRNPLVHVWELRRREEKIGPDVFYFLLFYQGFDQTCYMIRIIRIGCMGTIITSI